MPELVVTLEGKTARFPLPPDWTGKIELNIVRGFLSSRAVRATEDRFRCLDCGGQSVATASVTTTVPAR